MDFELSPELLRAIAPDVDPNKAQIKFDAKGTLHVLQRGDDGQLINDYALKHIEDKIQEETGPSKSDRLSTMKSKNKFWKLIFRLFTLSFIGFILPCLYMIYKSFNVSLYEYLSILIYYGCVISVSTYMFIWLIRNK